MRRAQLHHCTVEELDDGALYCDECGMVYEPEKEET